MFSRLCILSQQTRSQDTNENLPPSLSTPLPMFLAPPAGPLLLPSLAVIFDLYMDKGDVVRAAATSAVKAILKLFPPEGTRLIFRTLETILEAGKWKTKVGVLDAFKSFVSTSRDAVAVELALVLPKVENAMHDTKQEVSMDPMYPIQFSHPNQSPGICCCYKMCYIPLHDPRQSRSCSPHPRPCEVYGEPRLRACLHQGFILDYLCC